MEDIQSSQLWSLFADVTDLFDWAAVGAVLVFCTLLQAIWLGNTAARRLDAQQAVTIGYIRSLLSRLGFIQKFLAGVGDPRVVGSEAFVLVDEIDSELARLDPSALPTKTCVEAIQASRNAVLTIKGFV